ncbi:MAG: 4-(cytidine 5'-diphospho)-2-C-methyl-D-erythritol kinase [Brevundimonas sp.]
MRLTALAPAKVNLFLHVGPVAGDGYHPLTSLVAFADIGDAVTVEPGEGLSLTAIGPFGSGLEGPDNLIMTALRALGEAADIGEPGLRVTLDKQLPIAAGLGGGSSDAGAALRLARQALNVTADDAALGRVAAVIGADGPMCLFPQTAWAKGRGDVLTHEPRLPPLHAVLVNPGVPSPTGSVYRAYDAGPLRAADHPAPPADWSVETVIDWLAAQRNDLQDPAVALDPAIGEALTAVAATPGVALARMSGSGATVFGLCFDADTAAMAAERLSAWRPGWWVRACVLGGPSA